MNRIRFGFSVMRYLSLLIVLVAADVSAEPIREGGLYRENSAPEVYVIHGGKKVWIPSQDALFVMGYNWGQVQVVPDGTLQAFKRFDIPSSSPTPGSVVFPPVGGDSHHPLDGIPNTMTIISQGKRIQLAELRGWLRGLGAPNTCNPEKEKKEVEGGADFHYDLELDTDWALSNGIDLHKVLRVGNFAYIGHRVQGNPRAAVSLPIIAVELNSWGWRSLYPPGVQKHQKPKDWSHRQTECGVTPPVDWPYNPTQPDGSNPLRVGNYVRMFGSLVVDASHYKPPDLQEPGKGWCQIMGFCFTENQIWQGAVPDWSPRENPDSPTHPARWTEMHPPDFIEVMEEPKGRRVTVRGVALVGRSGWINTCEKQEFDIAPEAPRPSNGIVKYQELRSSYPELYFPWGENSDNGSLITIFSDHIHVKAGICGGGIGGSPGRFKALYRVWWEEGPPPKHEEEQPRKCHTTQKCCPNDTICETCVPHGRACPRPN